MNYKTRPKINPKIIFNDILPDTKTSLIIGKNNSDIVEILKSKQIEYTEFQDESEGAIFEFLNEQNDKSYDAIIFNFELCNYHRLENIINLLLNKSKYSIIRFRNHDINSTKITKKKTIYKIFKSQKINIIKRFYSKQNFFTKNILFRPFAYYTICFITKDKPSLNFEVSIVSKIKKLLFLKHGTEKLVINKK